MKGISFETPILDTLQSYEVTKRRKSRQMMFLQEVARRATEVFVGVTLLSLLVTLFTGLSVIHSYTYYAASTFLFPLLTRVLQRKYMFVVCNAILAFLIRCISRSSCYNSSRSFEEQGGQDFDHEDRYEVEGDKADEKEEEEEGLEVAVTGHPEDLDEQVPHHHVGPAIDLLMDGEEEKEDEGRDQEKVSEEVREGRSEFESVEGEYGGGDDYKENKVKNGEREMDYGASNNIESTEELNQKIEEFIRKMKRELQLEIVDAHSPHHLVPAA